MSRLAIRSQRVVTPGGERPATVSIVDGRISTVDGPEAPADVDLGTVALLPGLVDSHVHVNEPGRTEWEGFATATRAAAAGGVTTIVDMPLNSLPPTVNVAALETKRTAASGQSYVDVGFWGGALPHTLRDLPALHEAGVFGFKCFLVDSGVPEFPPLNGTELESALGGVPALFLVHAEHPHEIEEAVPSRRYVDFLASRPDTAEVRAIEQVVEAARRTGARVHVLHLSSARALPVIAAAKRDGVRITVETCPHYLSLTAESVPDGATEFKCCPPIRDTANRAALWQGLGSGVIDAVVSDHSPCTPDLKRREEGDFSAAWGGIASLQLGLPVVWTQARERGFGLSDVVRWMSATPAAIAGIPGKGGIVPGNDADLVAFAPEERWRVDPGLLHHRHPVTPYANTALSGVVRTTWLRGLPVGAVPFGRLLTRPA